MKKTRKTSPVKTRKDERKVMGRPREGAAIPVAESLAAMPESYASFFAAIRERIARERVKAVLAANAAMVLMYWDIEAARFWRSSRWKAGAPKSSTAYLMT
jgi:hypothetical protein